MKNNTEKIVKVDGEEIKVHMAPAAFAKGFNKFENAGPNIKDVSDQKIRTQKKKKELKWFPVF